MREMEKGRRRGFVNSHLNSDSIKSTEHCLIKEEKPASTEELSFKLVCTIIRIFSSKQSKLGRERLNQEDSL